MKTRLLVFLGIFLALLAGSAAAQNEYEPYYEEADCPFGEWEGITCGYLTVPEDRANPTGNQVQLAVAIIASSSDEPNPIPVVYLEGGPGISPLYTAEVWFKHPILESHTLILFDQRGTGFSSPSLNCPEIEAGTSDDPVAACRDRLLGEGVNLQAYNTQNNAADVADLVSALGYDQVKLWGISYGTKLALVTMREHPEIIESVVLDSVYPPETDDSAEGTIWSLNAYEHLFASCAADVDCNEAYPNLREDFYATVERLNNDPVDEVYGSSVADALFQALYDTVYIPYLPFALNLITTETDIAYGMDILKGEYLPDEDYGGEEETVADRSEVLAYVEQVGDIESSEGMTNSVDCQEEYLLGDYDRAVELAQSSPPELVNYMLRSVENNLAECQTWGVEPADLIETELVVSDLPVLIFAGEFDPVTPVSSAESALEGLENGQLLVFPRAGHSITYAGGDAHGQCAVQIMLTFWEDYTAELDTSCIEETAPLNFYIE